MSSKNKYQSILLILFYLIVCAIYLLPAISLPFDSGPDEAMRFGVVQGILTYNHIPRAFDPNGDISAGAGFGYSFYVSNLQYILMYIIYKIVNLFYHCNPLLIARLFSVFTGVMCVYVFDKILLILLPRLKEAILYRISLVAVYAFWPQIAFVFTYVNADSGALLLTNLLVLTFIYGWQNNWEKYEIYYLGIIIGCVMISYYNEYSVVLGVVLGFIIDVISRRLLTRKLICKLIIAFILGLIICGPFFLNNWLYYHDLFGFKLIKLTSNVFAPYSAQPAHVKTIFSTGHSIWYLIFDLRFWVKTIVSFIGWFGYLKILYYKGVYVSVIAVFVALSAIAISKLRHKQYSPTTLLGSLLIIGVTSFIITLLLFMSFSYFTSYQSQGRYLFPSFLFIILLPIYGIYVLRAERLAFSFALALFVLCCDGIRLQFSYYLVNLSWEYAVYIATAMILLGIVLYDKYLQRIFYFSIISIAILIGVKFIYFSYMQNLYLMSDKQFSLPVYRVSYNENRFNIKIKQINDRPVINDIVTLEHQYPINNILPLKIETSGDNGLGFYLLYDNMVFHSIQSLTKFDAHEKKTELFFLINNFNYLPEVNFSLGMYGDNTFIRYGAFVARFQ